MLPARTPALRLVFQATCIGLAVLSCVVFLFPTWRTPVVQASLYVLFFLVAGTSTLRSWRAGLLKLTVRELHARRVRSDTLETVAILAGIAAMMRFTFA